ncbi:lanthionine synthetase C family protein [Pseudoalteromonas xiamenensis]|uniref:lanthionine synthetase C family protein n=1 Tax=Pseudoalteromonas xiamenensis TaxID=882626 RepID=UPI0027E48BAB|nr:lanthionine synthetase C family protein [Pseudoalteromonas xiamenensis]WMN58591.1 lanthionine synthetase C family protein [Pseudoalteromonas xiamenensis]
MALCAQSMVSDEQRETINSILTLLTQKISMHIQSNQEYGLLGGVAGQLLFLYKMHQYQPDAVNEDLFGQQFELLQDNMAGSQFGLASGLAGQAWLIELLNQAEHEGYDATLLNDIDELLLRVMSVEYWEGEIEAINGLAGYAPYIIRRAKTTNQDLLFERLVTYYEQLHTAFPDGTLSWSQPSYSAFRFEGSDRTQPEFNLGLAHGVPGIIAALLPALQSSTLHARARALLEGACDWLVAERNPEHRAECAYGCATGSHRSRLGWCYGDLTIALTLARAGIALDRPNYVDHAREVALMAATRNAQSASIEDAGLCHGIFGLVTIFQLLNRIVPHPEFSKAHHYWLEYGLAKYAELGEQAFYTYQGIPPSYEEEFGFLMGYAGVGLALLSVLNEDLDWTESLLMA